MRVVEERVLRSVGSSAVAAKRFADALLGRTPTNVARRGDIVYSPESLTSEQSRLIEHFRWLVAIMPSRSAEYQRQLEERLAEEESLRSQSSSFATLVLEAEWDAAQHPRRGGAPNAGWFADKGTGTTASGTSVSGRELRVAPVSFKSGKRRPVHKDGLNDLVNRQRQIDELTGAGPSRQTKRAQGIAAKITSAGKLPGAVAGGLGSGLKTGGKSVVNGGATAIKNVATLGLSTSQLELIGVTQEDRANGYDTAVAIATASGEVLITVGTAGVAAALSNGGTVAQAVGGALVAYDAAGNAIGIVQGTYDAATDGISVRNAASVTANALGLTANLRSLGDLAKGRPNTKVRPKPEATQEEVDAFVSTLPRKKTPTNTPANHFEIKHTGPDNYTISGGGQRLDVDGYRQTTILEAKFIEKSKISPFVPGSSIPDAVRQKILTKTQSELRRAKTIIESGQTPFRRLEIITNNPDAKVLLEKLMKEIGVPGTVRLES